MSHPGFPVTTTIAVVAAVRITETPRRPGLPHRFDDIELRGSALPATAHLARVRTNEDGGELPIHQHESVRCVSAGHARASPGWRRTVAPSLGIAYPVLDGVLVQCEPLGGGF